MPVSSAGQSLIGPVPYLIAAARGDIAGVSVRAQFGRNSDVDTGPEDIWGVGGLWVPPTAARIHDIVSTDANDTAAGTGARTVRVEGLDAAGVEQFEVVTLNGLTPVPTVKSYTMINRMRVITAGTGLANAGDISATAQVDATITAQINVSANRTGMAIYRVPSTHRALLISFHGSMNKSAGASTRGDLRLQTDTGGNGIYETQHFEALNSAGTGWFRHEFGVAPLDLGPLDTAKLLCDNVDSNNTDVAGGFQFLLEEI